MTKRRYSAWISEATYRQLTELARLHGTQAETIAKAIDRMYREEYVMPNVAGNEPSERMKQVTWLLQVAEELTNRPVIAGTYDGDYGSAAMDAVRFWEDSVGELPEWYDDHDRQLLIKWITEAS